MLGACASGGLTSTWMTASLSLTRQTTPRQESTSQVPHLGGSYSTITPLAWPRSTSLVLEDPQHAGQHPDLADPDVLRDYSKTAVKPGVALAQERKGEDPEQRRHKTREKQPGKPAACPRLVRMFRHRVPRAV